jgi:hypothetical protein
LCLCTAQRRGPRGERQAGSRFALSEPNSTRAAPRGRRPPAGAWSGACISAVIHSRSRHLCCSENTARTTLHLANTDHPPLDRHARTAYDGQPEQTCLLGYYAYPSRSSALHHYQRLCSRRAALRPGLCRALPGRCIALAELLAALDAYPSGDCRGDPARCSRAVVSSSRSRSP